MSNLFRTSWRVSFIYLRLNYSLKVFYSFWEIAAVIRLSCEKIWPSDKVCPYIGFTTFCTTSSFWSIIFSFTILTGAYYFSFYSCYFYYLTYLTSSLFNFSWSLFYLSAFSRIFSYFLYCFDFFKGYSFSKYFSGNGISNP